GGLEAFFSKGKNINSLAEYTGTLASVQQKSLDMIVLLLRAAVKMKGRYDIVLDSIEELSQAQTGKVEVLNYLVKVKTMVSDLKERDDLLDSLLTYTNDLRESLGAVSELLTSTIDDFSAAQDDLTQRQQKSAERLGVLHQAEKELERKLATVKGELTTLDGKFQQATERAVEAEQRFATRLDERAATQARAIQGVNERHDQLQAAASELERNL